MIHAMTASEERSKRLDISLVFGYNTINGQLKYCSLYITFEGLKLRSQHVKQMVTCSHKSCILPLRN